MTTAKVDTGRTLILTAPTAGYTHHQVVVVGTIGGVIEGAATSGNKTTLYLTGVWRLPSITGTGTSWSQGAALYFDISDSNKLTNVQATGDIAAGVAWSDKATTDTEAEVLLNGLPE